MICVFPPDWTDFTVNGLGAITPSKATVTETLNGDYELVVEHPLDEMGKWQRLQRGYILRAPVPAAITPKVKLHTQDSYDVYKVTVAEEGDKAVLFKKGKSDGQGGRVLIKLAKYKAGTKMIVLDTSVSGGFYECVAPDGKHGLMRPSDLTFYTTKYTEAEATGEVIQKRQLRDQPFRIYRVVPDLEKVTVYARHVFYDLLDNMLQRIKPSKTATGATVVGLVSDGCLSDHNFSFYSNLTKKASGVLFENINPIEALLGEDGVIDKYDGELMRDWFDVFVVKRVGKDTQIHIRQGKNLTGISYDVDDTNVVTRIMPTGEDKDGKVLYLPEIYVDSPNIAFIENYIQPRWAHISVSDAKEVESDDASKAKSKAQCYVEMRDAAEEEFEKGCDSPEVTLSVNFVNVNDAEEYKPYGFLREIYLGDAVRVLVKTLGVSVYLRMTEYTFNCLTNQYESMTLGTVSDTAGTSMITSRQIPSGSIRGGKIAYGSVGAGQMGDEAIVARTIQAEAITTEKLAAQSITAEKIAAGAITAEKIDAQAITAEKIDAGAITAEKIDAGAITAEKIDAGAITAEKIAAGAVTAQKIDAGAITTEKLDAGAVTAVKIDAGAITAEKIAAHAIDADAIAAIRADIRELVAGTITTDQLYADLATIATAQITTAHMNSATIDWASITQLAADVAEIAQAEISQATIGTAQIENLSATIATIATAQITTAALQSANIQWANISNLAASIASIADAQIGSANITTAQITDLTAQIASVVNLAAQNGDFNFAKVASLVAGAMILSEGVGGSVCIDNLAATSAMMVSATLGELVLKGTDNKYYNVSVDADGTLHTQQTTVTSAEISAGETSTGKAIVGTSANIANLNAQTVKAQSAILSDIFAAALQADKISANQAFLASAAIPELRATVISALEDKLTLKGSQILFEAGDTTAEGALNALSSRLTVSEDGLSQVSTHMSEVDGTVDKVNSFFKFDLSDATAPVLTMGSTRSPMSMKLSNAKLSFLWNGSEVAYFSDNKLYVTNVEAIERLSVGTSANGYLDEVTTATGVGFLWRAS